MISIAAAQMHVLCKGGRVEASPLAYELTSPPRHGPQFTALCLRASCVSRPTDTEPFNPRYSCGGRGVSSLTETWRCLSGSQDEVASIILALRKVASMLPYLLQHKVDWTFTKGKEILWYFILGAPRLTGQYVF